MGEEVPVRSISGGKKSQMGPKRDNSWKRGRKRKDQIIQVGYMALGDRYEEGGDAYATRKGTI